MAGSKKEEKSMQFDYRGIDLEFWERNLEDFVPQEIYDMHTHLWTENGQEHLPPADIPLRMEVNFSDLCRYSTRLFPGRECHFLLLGTPISGMNTEKHNYWLAREGKVDPASAAVMVVTPDTLPGEINAGFIEKGFHAVKPYRIFAPDPKCARIVDFLPEKLLDVIDCHGKAVILHLSMPDGADSPQNVMDLRYLTKRYPNIKWVLAHCARAFNANFLERAVHILKHLPNIYYDTSAVNDLYTHYLLLKHEDLSRIMFGSDNIAAGCARGKYITYANAWQFYPGAGRLEHCNAEATLVIYEQLLQQKRAADMLELSCGDVKKIFWNNAKSFMENIKGKTRES